jgi:alkanesulfonate monooxygenase SsuD/methylene tetrahydromethanopterin reductase-like flavin-dependent oxidoreductase (luciferase family)
MREYGELGALVPPEAAIEFSYNNAQKLHFNSLTDEAIIGDPAQVGSKLREIASAYEIDEVVVLTWAFDPLVQRRSYQLLAEEFALSK